MNKVFPELTMPSSGSTSVMKIVSSSPLTSIFPIFASSPLGVSLGFSCFDHVTEAGVQLLGFSPTCYKSTPLKLWQDALWLPMNTGREFGVRFQAEGTKRHVDDYRGLPSDFVPVMGRPSVE